MWYHCTRHRRAPDHRAPRTRACSNQLENIPDDIISDPSLTRDRVECPKCDGQEAIVIQAKATPADDRIKLIFVCTNAQCVHKWQG